VLLPELVCRSQVVGLSVLLLWSGAGGRRLRPRPLLHHHPVELVVLAHTHTHIRTHALALLVVLVLMLFMNRDYELAEHLRIRDHLAIGQTEPDPGTDKYTEARQALVDRLNSRSLVSENWENLPRILLGEEKTHTLTSMICIFFVLLCLGALAILLLPSGPPLRESATPDQILD